LVALSLVVIPPATTHIYTLSLHDALPICQPCRLSVVDDARLPAGFGSAPFDGVGRPTRRTTLVAGGTRAGRLSSLGGNVVRPSLDRKSTRLNSSHVASSYAVFCLKKKKQE